MSQQNVIQCFIGEIHPWGVSAINGTLSLTAAGYKAAMTFQIPKTGSITKVGFSTNAVTTPQTLNVGIETMSGGNPSGTQYGGSAVGTQTSPASNTYYEVTLGTAASATRGDFVSIVIQWNATAGNLIIASGVGPTGNNRCNYTQLYNAVSWTKNWDLPICSIQYSDGTYGNMHCAPMLSVSETTFNNTSTPDERGLKFKLPVPVMLQGVYSRFGADNGSLFNVKLYDSDGTTVLQTLSVDQANLRASGDDFGKYVFPSGTLLNANTFYRVTFLPTNNTNCQLYQLTTQTAALLDGYAGGQNFMLTTRKSAGAWTDTSTARPFTGLIIEQVEDAAPVAQAVIVKASNSF